ncbi:hypothetical protein JOQ06_006395 [Pogonophryne albipinna]|uniref:Uncharacterized protein n=1 Tax=Pogonophryne albipinna TaxID=1090488 RepID=A0AAD6BI32_9TELE|nr:hypothetical protein JOQ06_006395 [Pogonophryne albipinna]
MGSSRTAGSLMTITPQEEEEEEEGEGTIPSTPSSWRLELESTSPELCLLTWSPLSSMRCALGLTASCSTLSS